jgi:hypothetical protein
VERFCLTEWRTIRGSSTIATITQGESEWLDLGEYDDAMFYLEVGEVSGTVTLTYQTCPSKDDLSFQAMLPPIAMATGARVDRVLGKYALVPVARYVRWQLTGSGSPYDATFQILIGAS